MIFTSMPSLAGSVLLVTVVGATCQFGSETLADTGPTIMGVVRDSSNPPAAVEGIGVVVNSPDDSQFFAITNTDENGRYVLSLNQKMNRININVYDPSIRTRPITFNGSFFESLGGLDDMVFNPIVFPASSPSLQAAGLSPTARFVRSLSSKLLENPNVYEPIQDYVKYVLDSHPAAEEFEFSNELSEIVTTLNRPLGRASPFGLKLAVEQGKLVYPNAQGTQLNIEQITREVLQPQRMTGERVTIPLNFDSPVNDMKFAPTEHGLRMFGNLDRFGHMKPFECQIDLDRSEVTRMLLRGGEDVTSAAGGTESPWLIRGLLDGSITITNSQDPTLSRTLQIGLMPVKATASSRDGSLIGGASLDGAYKVWKLREDRRLESAELILEGRLPKQFPNSMKFSPDNQALLIGTGLGDRDSAIVAMSLADNDQAQSATLETSSAVTSIEFGRESGRLLASQRDGATVVASLRRQNGQIEVRKDFALKGIEAATFELTGETAILKVDGEERPVLFPTEQLLRRSTFETPQLGIEMGDF